MTAVRTASRFAVFMVVVAVVWYAALITLAVRTANPPTLNARQVRDSNIVVIGTVADDGVVRVSQHYLAVLPKEPIRLVRDVAFPIGESILPLTRDGDLYRITETELPGAANRLTYPLTVETQKQLDEILKP